MGHLKLVETEQQPSHEVQNNDNKDGKLTHIKKKDQGKKRRSKIVSKLMKTKESWKTWYWNHKESKSKKRKFQKKMENEGKKTTLMRKTTEILPYKQIHDDYILIEDGVMDIFQVEPQNIYSLNNVDLEVLLLNRTQFLRSYFPSFKEVILNFPTIVDNQRKYWEGKKKKARSKMRLEYIKQKLFELDYLENERYNREFFLFVYADTKEVLSERKQEMIQNMQNSFPLKKLSRKKKLQILFLLNNQNTKL